MSEGFNLESYRIHVEDVARNLPACTLYEEAIRSEPGSTISYRGALIAYSGTKTGRSPSDKRIVRHASSQNDVWWGDVNISIDEKAFDTNRERAIDYFNTRQRAKRERIYVVDGFAGWDPRFHGRLPRSTTKPQESWSGCLRRTSKSTNRMLDPR